jgi:hypothetical protein
MKLWIARDGSLSSKNNEELWLYAEQPEYDTESEAYGEAEPSLSIWQCFILNPALFPEIKNGECVEAELKLLEKNK